MISCSSHPKSKNKKKRKKEKKKMQREYDETDEVYSIDEVSRTSSKIWLRPWFITASCIVIM